MRGNCSMDSNRTATCPADSGGLDGGRIEVGDSLSRFAPRNAGVRGANADNRGARRPSAGWVVAVGISLLFAAGLASQPIAADDVAPDSAQPVDGVAVLPKTPQWVTIANDGGAIVVGFQESAVVSTRTDGSERDVRRVPFPTTRPITVLSTPDGTRLLMWPVPGKITWHGEVLTGEELVRRMEREGAPPAADQSWRWAVAVDPTRRDGEWAVLGKSGPWFRFRDLREGRPVIEFETASSNALGVIAKKTRAIPGINTVGGCAIHPSGEWLLVTHLVPKSDLPSTQTDQGWVFTNAVSIVRPGKLDEAVSVQTLPLDLRTEAFSNPGAVTFSLDGERAYVAHVGADVVSVLSVPKLLEAAKSLPVVAEGSPPRRLDPRLTRRYVTGRIAVGAGPSALSLSPDGKRLAVANRWEPTVSVIDTESLEVVETRVVGEGVDTASARGERLFHDGRLSLGGQFSCASCHPNGDQDGLNWDLPGDGDPSFLNTKSLAWLDGTAPYGWRGNSGELEARIKGTLTHLFGYAVTEAEASDLAAYLHAISDRPTKSPSVTTATPDSGLHPGVLIQTDLATGRRLFEKAGCAKCHSGDKLTDGERHALEVNGDAGEFDTPSLLGLEGTAPYWHDGRAKEIDEVFDTVDPKGPHGVVKGWSEEDRESLRFYLETL